MFHSVSEIKIWGMKQIFVTINYKIKIKTYLIDRGTIVPLSPPFYYSTYIDRLHRFSIQKIRLKYSEILGQNYV